MNFLLHSKRAARSRARILPGLLFTLLWLGQFPGSLSGEETASPPRIRSSQEVARRVVILHALHALRFQAGAEKVEDESLLESMHRERQRLGVWLHREGLWEDLDEDEKALILSKPREVSPVMSRELFTLEVDVLTLLHCLGLHELPFPDGRPDLREEATLAVPTCGESTREFIESARRNSEPALRTALQMTELWNYRAILWEKFDARAFPAGEELRSLVVDLEASMAAVAMTPRPMPDGEAFFRELIRYTAYLASGQDMAHPPVEDDFPAFGKAYRKLDSREHHILELQARRRLEILRWILNEKTTASTWFPPVEKKEEKKA